MKYIIYKLVNPSLLVRIDQSSYRDYNVERTVLEKLDIHGVEEQHSSMESAIEEIQKHSKELKGMNLTVLPVFAICWDGEIL